MTQLAAFLFSALGAAMCFHGDKLREKELDGVRGLNAHSWDLYGSVFLCVGLGILLVAAVMDWRTQKQVTDAALRRR